MTDQYNDHYEAFAFVNRVRIVEPDRGNPYPALSLAVKHGAKHKEDGEQWTEQLQCTVITEQAKFVHAKILSMLETYADTHNLDLKKDWKKLPSISARFKVGDLKPDFYMNNSGTPVPLIKGRLLKLTHVYVEGELFYEGVDDNDSSSAPDSAQDDQKPNPEPRKQGKSSGAQSKHQTPEFDPWMGEPLPDRVKLNKADPAFQQKKEHLKQQGYHWNSKEQFWYRPEAAAA